MIRGVLGPVDFWGFLHILAAKKKKKVKKQHDKRIA